jgi:hypothetical protein
MPQLRRELSLLLEPVERFTTRGCEGKWVAKQEAEYETHEHHRQIAI